MENSSAGRATIQQSPNETIRADAFQSIYYRWRGRSGKAVCRPSVLPFGGQRVMSDHWNFLVWAWYLSPNFSLQPRPQRVIPPFTHWYSRIPTCARSFKWTRTTERQTDGCFVIQFSGLDLQQSSQICHLHAEVVGVHFLKTVEWANLRIWTWFW